MPFFVVDTNVPKEKVPSSLVTELSALMAELTGKPESYVSIQINAGQLMTWGGTSDPCALCTFGCIGKISLEENTRSSKALGEKLRDTLNVQPDRMYINFTDLARQNVGYNLKTFAT